MTNLSDYFAYDETAPFLLRNLKDRGTKAKAGDYTHGSLTNHGYYVTGLNKKRLSLHRIIWELNFGKIPEGYEIDHINMDRTDNRISNLRLASRTENNLNRKKYKGRINDDLPKGIYHHPSWGNTYQAKIAFNGKKYSKSSTDISLLISWLEEKRKELHGDFRRS
jgi:HNH endonuclease